VLLEEHLGCNVIHRLTGGAPCRARSPTRFVRGKKFVLQRNLDTESFKGFSESVCTSRGGSAGAVLEGGQTKDDSRRTDLCCQVGNLKSRPIDPRIWHDLEW
jgi:hypothetical protein